MRGGRLGNGEWDDELEARAFADFRLHLRERTGSATRSKRPRSVTHSKLATQVLDDASSGGKTESNSRRLRRRVLLDVVQGREERFELVVLDAASRVLAVESYPLALVCGSTRADYLHGDTDANRVLAVDEIDRLAFFGVIVGNLSEANRDASRFGVLDGVAHDGADDLTDLGTISEKDGRCPARPQEVSVSATRRSGRQLTLADPR